MLGSFLRSRRLRRRSAHGRPFTQSAVAEAAAVSVDLYARLERGTGIAVSAQTFTRIARSLDMGCDEMSYARNLLTRGARRLTDVSRAIGELSALAETLTAHPAFVANHRWDIVTSNRAFRSAQSAAGRASAGSIVRNFFTCAAERETRPDWERAADRMVSMLRMDYSLFAENESFGALVSDLRNESPDFARRWDEHDVRCSATSVDGVVVTGDGRVRRYRSVPFTTSRWDDLEFVVQVPYDCETGFKE